MGVRLATSIGAAGGSNTLSHWSGAVIASEGSYLASDSRGTGCAVIRNRFAIGLRHRIDRSPELPVRKQRVADVGSIDCRRGTCRSVERCGTGVGPGVRAEPAVGVHSAGGQGLLRGIAPWSPQRPITPGASGRIDLGDSCAVHRLPLGKETLTTNANLDCCVDREPIFLS